MGHLKQELPQQLWDETTIEIILKKVKLSL
jgi:hypothetical protein